MRTTLDFPDAVLRELKAKAAVEDPTLAHLVLALVEQGLRGGGDQPLATRSFTNADLFETMND